MTIRILDGDAPSTVDLLLPGFRAAMAHDLPGDPPAPPALLARLLQRRRGTDRLVLAVFREERPVGYSKLGMDLNADLDRAHGSLWIFPGDRRSGAGRELLAAVRSEVRTAGRSEVLLDAPRTAAADGFADALGGERAASNVRSRLALRAPAPVPEAPAGIRLVRWNERCPDELAEAYAALQSGTDAVVNGQARSAGLTVADVRTAEREALHAEHRQYAVAGLSAAGRMLGFSTLYVRNSPMADAGQTVVAPGSRRRGLGTLLKRELVAWAAGENPQVAVVQAWNAEDNDAIRALNRRIGFVTDQVWSTYRFPA
jgi:GNAT superfamily N-acetyltransferase